MSNAPAFTCRLYLRDEPYEPIDVRTISTSQITLGRDPSADWRLPDPDGAISRIHCTLRVLEDRLWLVDHSRNGTFLDTGERAPAGEPVEIASRQSFDVGALRILVDRACEGRTDETSALPAAGAGASSLPEDWSDGAPTAKRHRDASLIEAFCEGARLDASVFSGEDPEALMRRAGAIYQQTVIGLATLMADRAHLRDEALCDLTVINAADNNPFKWSATRTLAEDLLRPRDGAFLADADAVRASFEDLAQHMSAVFKAANAAADLVLHAFAPDAIEAEARPQASLLQGRSAACWQAHNRRYAELAKAGGGDTPMRRAFASAYSEAIRPTSERPTTLARRARA